MDKGDYEGDAHLTVDPPPTGNTRAQYSSKEKLVSTTAKAPAVAARFAEISVRKAAIIAGFGILLMIIFEGVLGNSIVLQTLTVPGDAAKTAGNIMTNGLLFRIGVSSFVIGAIFDAVTAWALYVTLKPVNISLALLAALFRLAYAGILGIAANNLLSVLQLLSGSDYLKVFGAAQLNAQVMLSVNAFGSGWFVATAFFGIHLFVLGYLVFKSGYIPRIIGAISIVAGLGYLVDGFAYFLLPNYTDYATIFLLTVDLAVAVAELSLVSWLLLKAARISEMASGYMPGKVLTRG